MRVSVRVGSLLHGARRPVRYRRSCMDPDAAGVVQVERGPIAAEPIPSEAPECTTSTSRPGAGPAARRRSRRGRPAGTIRPMLAAGRPATRRFAVSLAMAPALVVALVATGDGRKRRHLAPDRGGLSGDREPGPAAGRGVDGVHDTARGCGVPGGARLPGRRSGRSKPGRWSRPTAGRAPARPSCRRIAPEHGYVIPGFGRRRRTADDGRGPAHGRHRRRRLLRGTDAVTDRVASAGARGCVGRRERRPTSTTRAPSRPRSARTTPAWSGGSCSCSATSRTPQDMAQDAYLKAFRSWDRFDGGRRSSVAVHDRVATRVQPPSRPAPLAGSDPAAWSRDRGPTPSIRICGRRWRGLEARDPVGAAAERRRRLHAGRNRPRCCRCRKGPWRAGSRAHARPFGRSLAARSGDVRTRRFGASGKIRRCSDRPGALTLSEDDRRVLAPYGPPTAPSGRCRCSRRWPRVTQRPREAIDGLRGVRPWRAARRAGSRTVGRGPRGGSRRRRSGGRRGRPGRRSGSRRGAHGQPCARCRGLRGQGRRTGGSRGPERRHERDPMGAGPRLTDGSGDPVEAPGAHPSGRRHRGTRLRAGRGPACGRLTLARGGRRRSE